MKKQPAELNRQPLITEKDLTKDEEEFYMGRAIIEFWGEEGQRNEDPAFAWIVDAPDQPDEEWVRALLNGLKRAVEHIENVYGHQHQGTDSSQE